MCSSDGFKGNPEAGAAPYSLEYSEAYPCVPRNTRSLIPATAEPTMASPPMLNI